MTLIAVLLAQFIVPRPRTLYWDLADTLANVQTYTTTLTVDSGAAQSINPVCVDVGGVSATCHTTVPGDLRQSHTLLITVTLGGSNASGSFSYHP